MWILIFYVLITTPILTFVPKSNHITQASEDNLKKHVQYLTSTQKERNYKEVENLSKIADYLYDEFKNAGCDDVYFQKFIADKKEYKNIICDFKWINDKKIVIGAHYDVDSDNVFNQPWEVAKMYYPGADDNASGVAWVLELASMIWKNKTNLNHSIELVAYCLEEMPFFESSEMWSYVHAKSLHDNWVDIEYMISLEMLWYFSDENIQTYPVNFLGRIYPKKWNFIAIVGKIFDFNMSWLKTVMMKNSDISIKSLSSPSFVGWIDLSDHSSYWKFGYRAYMITDTSFFRNKNYHTPEDTIDKLDFKKMKEVVNGVYWMITN